MIHDFNHIDLIERYIDGTITAGEKQEAERLLNEHPGLMEEYSYMKMAVESVKLSALHKQVANIAKVYHHKNKQPAIIVNMPEAKARGIGFYTLRIAAVIAIVFACYTGIQYATITPDKLYRQSFVDYNLPTVRGGIKEMNIEKLYKMERWEDVLKNVSKEDTQKEKFLAGMAALQLNKPAMAAGYFEEIIDTNKTLAEKPFTQESEYYLAMTLIKMQQYNKARSLINEIKKDPEHTYYSQANKVSMFKTMLLSLK